MRKINSRVRAFLLFPIAAFLFAVGWLMNILGDKARSRARRQDILVLQALPEEEC